MDISSMLEVQVDEVKEVDIKENVTPRDLLPSTTNVPSPVTQEELSFYKLVFGNDISAVRFRRLHCTACDTHIGSAPAESYNMFEHPVLHTLLCAKCRNFYGDGTFEQGDDATDMFCRWCANGGNLYCCSFCSNTFCYKCIRRNFDPILRKKIEADEKWKCFVCNPRDLYTARAICWALLQHVQTVHRLLQNNRNLTDKEIEEKMNLDETNCCPRRRKRKYRSYASNSDDEDVTYTPTPVETIKRRKKGRGRGRILNGSSIPTSHGGTSDDCSIYYSRPPPLIACKPTIIEGENSAMSSTNAIVAQHQTTSMLHKAKSTVVQHPTMYNTTIMNVVAPNFLHSNSSVVPISHVSNSMNQLNQVNVYQTMPYTPVPMVTIPNQNVNILSRPQYPVTETQSSYTTPKPSVIEIESDSEDVAVVSASKESLSFKNHVAGNVAVPVALVSSKNNFENTRYQETPAKFTEKTLNQHLLSHSQEVDNVLTNLKIEFQNLFDESKKNELKHHELNNARDAIKKIHYIMRNAVTRLACINDRMIRDYNRWKEHRAKTITSEPSSSKDTCDVEEEVEEEVDVTLSMVCENESDSEYEAELSYIKPSEFIGTMNVVDSIEFFKKRNTVNRAVGDDSVLSANKSIQIYDAELQDYDRCIRHATLEKSNEETEEQDVSSPNDEEIEKQPSNYEKHFIQFVQEQNTEDQDAQDPKNLPDPNETSSKDLPDPNETSSKDLPDSNETPVKDLPDPNETPVKDLPDPNETPLKDLIEANSPFISEMLETMDKSVVPSTSSTNDSTVNEKSSTSATKSNSSITYKPVDDLIVVDDNLGEGETFLTSSPIKVLDKSDSSDDLCVLNVMKREPSTSRTKYTLESESSNEDDCTIIDD